ncbi:response regulator [Marinoscillum furvescens]|uniref:Response regulator receiver domain-containing protein n=1 Tax=Marinoscillum furvescens DSM 4134 TaxID=1122208 RepID=A0A3D9KW42_MARFU|nr:response regulator [Marinoscillum furvescens]RED91774.1 response regulator receiver domain-containing protein [Marinoscillum furvescens DSM 4134]
MKTVDCIMLIDDNEDDNFFHERVIRKSQVTRSIVVKETGEEALDYLSAIGESESGPDLIFLDINMPGMNGWEFLDEYKKLADRQSKERVIVMLTTSDNPDDIKLANSMDVVANFQTKPLTKESLADILQNHM